MGTRILIFIYDELMVSKTRELARLNLTFVSYAYTKGKLLWFNDTKYKRIFLTPLEPNKSKAITYGAIFVINDFEKNRLQLFSYYASSIPYTNTIMQEDFYKLENITCTPIKFNNISDIENVKYKMNDPIECLSFIGNESNALIKKSLNNRRYYGYKKPLMPESFIKLIKENTKGENYELDRC